MREEARRLRGSEVSTTTEIERLDIILVNETRLREAQQWVSGCEKCTEDAAITFDYLLDAVTGCNPTNTEYLMRRPISCPECSNPIKEKTLVAVV
jgi:hypothetical protein